jgi:hypothetical protein
LRPSSHIVWSTIFVSGRTDKHVISISSPSLSNIIVRTKAIRSRAEELKLLFRFLLLKISCLLVDRVLARTSQRVHKLLPFKVFFLLLLVFDSHFARKHIEVVVAAVHPLTLVHLLLDLAEFAPDFVSIVDRVTRAGLQLFKCVIATFFLYWAFPGGTLSLGLRELDFRVIVARSEFLGEELVFLVVCLPSSFLFPCTAFVDWSV